MNLHISIRIDVTVLTTTIDRALNGWAIVFAYGTNHNIGLIDPGLPLVAVSTHVTT